MSKKFFFFIVLFYLTGVFSIVQSDIVPLKKPLQTKEETERKLLIDILKPLPKPIKKNETKIVEEKVIVKKEKKIKLILPKKKPLIAGSKEKTDIKISKYYNKKDFNLANKAISEMKKAQWASALKIAKKELPPSLLKLPVERI